MKSERPAILVVDDNEDNRYTLQTLLEADGFERIASAAGGNEAISLIEKEKFSLVLLDMMMPDLNGDEVLRLIRSKAETRDIPVVMISADTDTDKISKCIELGADDYLPKPFNPDHPPCAHWLGPAAKLSADDGGRISVPDRETESAFRDFVTEHPAGRDRRSPSQR